MSSLTLKVNGGVHTLDIDPSTPLLYILRNDLGLQGPRFGCGLGQCGLCTVIINGVATRSCITPTSTVKGEITTLEGLAKEGKLHPLQQAWIDEQVPQCGFCQNGQIMTAKALLDKNPKPQPRDFCRVLWYRQLTNQQRQLAERVWLPKEPPALTLGRVLSAGPLFRGRVDCLALK
jgi:aerobic-type carbon monoxide dehydrogenase small subunit (CoxS/CutS family)